MKVKFTAHYGAFNQGEEHELREAFANQLIEDGVVKRVDSYPPFFSDETIKKLDEMIKAISKAERSVVQTLRASKVLRGATKSQRHALVVKYDELSTEISELQLQEEKYIRNSKKVEPWIKETFKLDIALKLRTRALIMDYIIKNRFPTD